MKRSSLITLIVCGILLVYLGTVFFSVQSQSRPDFTQQDAVAFLDRLAKAFDAGSTEGVLSFAAPDAKVAGRDLDDIRQLLHRAFYNIKDPHVQFSNLNFDKRDETTAYLRFDAQVVDKGQSGGTGDSSLYTARMGFTVKRILMPKLGGILHAYEWKVTDVDAPHLPSSGGLGI
jgi:hypothetical protein